MRSSISLFRDILVTTLRKFDIMVRDARSKADFAQWELTAMHLPWGGLFRVEWERAREGVGTTDAQARTTLAAAEKELPTAQRSETARVETANPSSGAAASSASSSVAPEAVPEPASNKQAEDTSGMRRMP